MKKYMNEVPEYVTAQLQKAREARASEIMTTMGKVTKLCTTPVRPVKMRILKDEQLSMDMVIIPAVDIYAKDEAFFDDGEFLDRNCLFYHVADTRKAFPLGHVYKGSGNLCLGNIFVPSKVPLHSPQQPLETLFLHNDRNLSHGGASLRLSKSMIDRIKAILLVNNIRLSDLINTEFKPEYELLEQDTIWRLSKEVYDQKDPLNAINIMTQIYNIIFGEEERK